MAKQDSSNANIWRISFLVTATILLVLILTEVYFRIIPAHVENIGPGFLTPKPSSSYHDSKDGSIGSVFQRIDVLEDMSPAGDEAWHSLLIPKRGGYIFTRPEDPSSNEPEPWGISMFHSLHCLSMLRTTIQEQQGLSTKDTTHHHMRRDADDDDAMAKHNHTIHCLSYLAQALTCCGDGTLEKAIHVKTDRHFVINGQGVLHQCRDTSLLWDVTLKSEREPVTRWVQRKGDTVYDVWGKRA